MRKPDNILYCGDETPPAALLVTLGVQHAVVMSLLLVTVAVIARAGRMSADEATNIVSLTLLGLACGTLFQVRRFGPFGSGLLAIPSAQSIYVPGCIIAARAGGLPMVTALVMTASLLEMSLSRCLRAVRGMLPTELSGLIVMVTGLSVAQGGMNNFVEGLTAAGQDGWARGLGVTVLTLGLMVGLSVWGRGTVRTCGAIIGVATGYAASLAAGLVDPGAWQAVLEAPLLRIPQLSSEWPVFSLSVLPTALLTGLAITLNSTGALTAAQRLNDADWRRQDMDSLSRGLLADGLGAFFSALLGGVGIGASGSSVGLTATAQVTSRAVGYVAAGVYAVAALLPKFALLVVSVPAPVLGAALVFLSCSLLVSGISMMTSRLLDARKTFCLGIAFAFAVATPALTRAGAMLPPWMAPIVGTPLLSCAMVAILLNPLLRIGIRKQAVLEIPPGGLPPADLIAFIARAGAGWGARRDVIAQAQGPIAECLDTIAHADLTDGPVRLALGFNELQLDARISWRGEPLPLSTTRPTREELLLHDDGALRMAGYLIARLAGKVTSRMSGGTAELHMKFDH